ncbi:MAG: nicotinate-nucleotide adenylyltransferase [Proteobacteria bacterium]|nr:nicotinate-nucleotide adenylyltransferase [Pseudomonadota bacterium]
MPAGDVAPRRVGLLGGSFNPAHAGHVHISRLALERLGLDEVWWLVSPQNPLKPTTGMAPLAERLANARAVAGPGVRVTDLEALLGTRYTADTVAAVRRRWPGVRFVWLAGADLLLEMPRWRRWRHLFRLVPIAVFARGPLVYRAVCGRAARRFAAARVDERYARGLARARSPAWMMLDTPRHPGSATRIRAGRNRP